MMSREQVVDRNGEAEFLGKMVGAISDRTEQWIDYILETRDPILKAKQLGLILGLAEASMLLIDQKLKPVKSVLKEETVTNPQSENADFWQWEDK